MIHALVTDEKEFGFSLSSPQLPQLAFGRATQEEFMRDFRDALEWAGFRAGRVIGHIQNRGVTPQGAEIIIRRQTGGETEPDRVGVAEAINRVLGSETEAPAALADLHASATGEYIFVACLASDTVGWLIDQLRPERDVLVAVLAVSDVMLGMSQFASDTTLDWPTVDELGWDRETTLGDLQMRAAASGGAPALARV